MIAEAQRGYRGVVLFRPLPLRDQPQPLHQGVCDTLSSFPVLNPSAAAIVSAALNCSAGSSAVFDSTQSFFRFGVASSAHP